MARRGQGICTFNSSQNKCISLNVTLSGYSDTATQSSNNANSRHEAAAEYHEAAAEYHEAATGPRNR